MRVLALILLLSFAAATAAQLRTIPNEARPGQMRHLQEMQIELDGKPRYLSAGAQIRDAENRLILPIALRERTAVHYLLDGSGMVHRVWILTPQERAALQPAPVLK